MSEERPSKTKTIAKDLGISPSELESRLELIQEKLDAQALPVLTDRHLAV